jgi:hypothetical protein
VRWDDGGDDEEYYRVVGIRCDWPEDWHADEKEEQSDDDQDDE